MAGHYYGYLPNAFVELKMMYNMVYLAKKSSFITLTHNHIRYVTAKLLSQVTNHVKIGLVLQSVTGLIQTPRGGGRRCCRRPQNG